MHTLQPDQIRSIHHAELATSYAEPGRQLEIVNESSDLHLNTLTIVIDSTKRTGLRPHTTARGLSVVTNTDKIFLVNNGFFGNPTLWSIYKVLNLRDDGTIPGPQPKRFGQRMYIIRYNSAQESSFN